MKIRTAEGQEYHLNDYHFIHRYRFVKKIGGSTGKHAVLHDDFREWSELAEAATAAQQATFRYGGYTWEKHGDEIFPIVQDRTVNLTGDEIDVLAVVFQQDGEPPSSYKGNDFGIALRELRKVAAAAVTEVLDIQWPRKLPPGVGYDPRTVNGPGRDRYIWGVDGDLEYPHIHCFLEEGYITSARATVSPGPRMKSKRGFVFLSDLKVARNDLLPGDDKVLDELERVLKAIVTGEELSIPTVATEKKGKKKDKVVPDVPAVPEVPEVEYDEEFVAYANANEVPVVWVHRAATACGIAAEDIGGFPLGTLVEQAAIENVKLAQYSGSGKDQKKRKK